MYQPALDSKKPDVTIRLISFADLLPHFNITMRHFISLLPQKTQEALPI